MAAAARSCARGTAAWLNSVYERTAVVFRFATILVTMLAIGLFSISGTNTLSVLAYSAGGSDSLGFPAVIAAILVVETTVNLINGASAGLFAALLHRPSISWTRSVRVRLVQDLRPSEAAYLCNKLAAVCLVVLVFISLFVGIGVNSAAAGGGPPQGGAANTIPAAPSTNKAAAGLEAYASAAAVTAIAVTSFGAYVLTFIMMVLRSAYSFIRCVWVVRQRGNWRGALHQLAFFVYWPVVLPFLLAARYLVAAAVNGCACRRGSGPVSSAPQRGGGASGASGQRVLVETNPMASSRAVSATPAIAAPVEASTPQVPAKAPASSSGPGLVQDSASAGAAVAGAHSDEAHAANVVVPTPAAAAAVVSTSAASAPTNSLASCGQRLLAAIDAAVHAVPVPAWNEAGCTWAPEVLQPLASVTFENDASSLRHLREYMRRFTGWYIALWALAGLGLREDAPGRIIVYLVIGMCALLAETSHAWNAFCKRGAGPAESEVPRASLQHVLSPAAQSADHIVREQPVPTVIVEARAVVATAGDDAAPPSPAVLPGGQLVERPAAVQTPPALSPGSSARLATAAAPSNPSADAQEAVVAVAVVGLPSATQSAAAVPAPTAPVMLSALRAADGDRLPTKPAAGWDSERHATRLQADRDIDFACAWGTTLTSIAVVSGIYALCLRPGLGALMLLNLVFLLGNACVPRAPRSACGIACKIVLIIVAAIFGVFSSAKGLDDGKTKLIVMANTTSPVPQPTMAYGVCSNSVAGLSIMDYCVLSAVAYSNDTYMRTDVANWFAPVGYNVTELQLGRMPSGLRYNAYRRVDTAAPPGGGALIQDAIYVATRGSREERDFSADLALWNEALLFKVISAFGPYSSFPIPAQQLVLSVLSRSAAMFDGTAEDGYVRDLLASVRSLRASYPNSTIVLAGHSLGGGLSVLVGSNFDYPSISFSGPGTVLTGYKIGMDGTSYDTSFTIIPDRDVVPRVDYHVGTVQNIRCSAPSAPGCHSIATTCCELLRSCGDPYGRQLAVCGA